MGRIEKLEDIEIYKVSLDLAREVYSLTKDKYVSRDFSLVNQVRSAALSVAANIAEGFGRRTKKDFAQFLSMSLGSANEVIAYLDFTSMEYKIPVTDLREKYILLTKRIYSFRSYLLR